MTYKDEFEDWLVKEIESANDSIAAFDRGMKLEKIVDGHREDISQYARLKHVENIEELKSVLQRVRERGDT